MLRSLDRIRGYTIQARDGDIGQAKDSYFDDREWIIRYLVVDTAKWLPSRLVLISPTSVGQPDWKTERVPVNLTKDQIERSPGIEIDKPVSLQKESQLARYYRWPAYWGGIDPLFPAPLGGGPIPVPEETQAAIDEWESIAEEQANLHLRSAIEVTGYTIHATDGEIGYAMDLIADIDAWTIRYLVIDTHKWLPSKHVLIAPQWIKEVDWAENLMHVDLTQGQIKDSPEYDSSAPINREFELQMYDYYGRPCYWS
ncbi:PRC-barrel domain-containing protein [Nitrospira sp. M1]